MINNIKNALVLASLFFAGIASASIIEQTDVNVHLSVNFYDPIGQSFTAEDSSVIFEYGFVEMHSGFPTPLLNFTLYEGNGFGGVSLYTTDFDLDGLTDNGSWSADLWKAFDLSAVNLDVGSVYTAAIQVYSSQFTAYGIAGYKSSVNAYADGEVHLTSPWPYSDLEQLDLAFRVTPTAASLPTDPAVSVSEPMSFGLVLLSALPLILRRRRALV